MSFGNQFGTPRDQAVPGGTMLQIDRAAVADALK
jgi:hypothetical protein